MDDKGLYAGLMRLHILHKAAEDEVCGVWVTEELRRHGYELSPGTLYPMLHGLEKKGYLQSYKERDGKTMRRIYSITPRGKLILGDAKEKVRDLFGELFEAPR
ncbi:MAG: helix-turn-helix transcriptional regulator [Alphaproteobacteria bacterium]|jgi:PadR family transcriptional regulator, regulatory protein PadR|nr:PadR family transcriptional regulator [Rhodospirillaceae bacterium]MBT6206260.1 PadR family transcriptional regulator [Rhodospirillaceae bacterium]MBT6509829.1 PadR family transcriptional regulator [Rhodospirillaceae bacterium]MBT7647918.1 PadR family transcriptional regulator [Rhodospirillaceae bacterium]MDG2480634.1 helix-turn-helix transcriptional regulator [Alphaproteobacteria bacterium]